MFKNIFKKKIMALAILGVIMVTGSVTTTSQAAVQKKYYFDMSKKVNINRTLKFIHEDNTIYKSTGRSNAKVVVIGRSPKDEKDGFVDCPVYFVHKKHTKDKYVTMGVWMWDRYDTINCTYLSNSGVKKNTLLETHSKTMKDSAGSYNAALYGKIWY